MLPLSKKIFEAALEDRFKLKITTSKGQILEIGYRQFLSDRILILKERIENDPRHGKNQFSKLKTLNYAITTIHNLPTSVYENCSPNGNTITFSTALAYMSVELFIYLIETINTHRKYHSVLDDTIMMARIISVTFFVISITFFIAGEKSNQHLLPSVIQRNLIEQRAAAVYARQQLPKLETHFEELMALYHAQ